MNFYTIIQYHSDPTRTKIEQKTFSLEGTLVARDESFLLLYSYGVIVRHSHYLVRHSVRDGIPRLV